MIWTLLFIQDIKRLSDIYAISLDDLIDFDLDMKEIEKIIERSDEKKQDKVDWTETG